MALLRILYFVPAVIVLATIEGVVLDRLLKRDYDWKAYFVSLFDVTARELIYLLPLSLATPLFIWAWDNRIATVPLDSFAAFFALFIGMEFFYYWFHRCSHRMRWFWATHAVHHSPNQLNLSAAYRFGWTGRLTGTLLFYVPMVWLGFPIIVVVTALGLNLLYQFWLHVTWIPKLGWLEYVINTPSHHRVHHAANREYIDANYGGVLIIFDRIFGTFVAERDDVPCRYGLVTPLKSYNPIFVALHEWIAMGRDLLKAKTWRDRIRQLFGPPGRYPESAAAD
ncbi:MAG: sterol desaturase family protein [Alphaproteobacteria bacterium]|nr:sterol desaturase family protein [Alphaproteobacteria bacterium]